MTLVLSGGPADGSDAEARTLPARPLRSFPRLSKLLHWLTAAMVLAMFITGVVMKQLGEGPLADVLYTLHKMAGVGAARSRAAATSLPCRDAAARAAGAAVPAAILSMACSMPG